MRSVIWLLARAGAAALLWFAVVAAANAADAVTGVGATTPVPADDQRQLDGLIREWPDTLLALTDPLPLDSDMQVRAATLSAELRPALEEAARRWLGEIQAERPGEGGPGHAKRLMARMNDELVRWLVAGAGAERAALEWQLAQTPGYCRERARLHERRWAFLAERLLFLQPLQGAERDAAVAAERERWQRWLAGDLGASGGPLPAPQLQAFQAAERLRAGQSNPPQPMTPWLARQVLGENPPKLYDGLMQTCALMQWWLRNEVQRLSLPPEEVMTLFRHGTLPVSEDLLLMPPAVREAARAAAAGEYPPIAGYFGVTGTVGVEVVLDAAGRVRDVQVTRRQLQVQGQPGDPVPVAFEQTLDRATFARVRAMPFDKPDPATLRNGQTSLDLELVWSLQ